MSPPVANDDVSDMAERDDLRAAARRADSLVLVSYNAYVRTRNHEALRHAAEHAYEAANALMKADGVTASEAPELIERNLPGVRTVMHAAADQMAAETAARLRGVWRLMQLPGASPAWDDDERDVALRLLVAALVSDELETLDIRERVARIPHRRAANMVVAELERSERPWKSALSADEYGQLLHRFAPRTGPGRGLLCTAVKRLPDKTRVASTLALWLDAGAQRETLASSLDAALTACLPAVLV